MIGERAVNSNKIGIFIGGYRRCRRFCHGRYPMDNGHIYLLGAFQVEENSRSYDCPVLATFTEAVFYVHMTVHRNKLLCNKTN
jgi:hypothetical protein